MMKHAVPSKKIIRLEKKMLAKKGTIIQNENCDSTSKMRVIAISSGKGGVGKTNIVANLGFSLSQLGKKVFILDADLGLGNLDILLGMTPKYNLSHVVAGLKTIAEITVEGPGKMNILPASSGIQELTQLGEEHKTKLLKEIDVLKDFIDILLIDTAAGISSNVLYFNAAAQDIMVVVAHEPASITDAYALMKVLSLQYSTNHFKLLVNLAANKEEAYEVYRQLNLVADRFLDITIEYIGYVLFDENVTKSVRRQKVVSELYPNSQASKCFVSIANKICESPPHFPQGDTSFFWKHLLQKKS